MDVLDAGVYVAKWEGAVPPLQTVLWGPLQAREMGFDGWQWQDGGETGFVAHHQQRLATGVATSCLIVQNRTRKAYLSVMLAGFPANVPAAQRRLEQDKVVGEAQAFLTRLARRPVSLAFQGEVTLLDNVNDAAVPAPAPVPVLREPGVWEV